MPAMYNGVYVDKSVPGLKNVGCGTGVSNSGPKDAGMGGNQNQPSSPSYTGSVPSSHDKQGNSTYKYCRRNINGWSLGE